MRNSFKYVSKANWTALGATLIRVCHTKTLAEAEGHFADFKKDWEQKNPAVIRLWECAWSEFVPFSQFDREIRRIVCTANAIELVNARIR